MSWFSGKKKEAQADPALLNQWADEAQRRVDFTPDMWAMEQYEYQLMFVYNEMARGHPAFDLVNDAGAFVSTAFTNAPGYTLWKKKLGQATQAIALAAPLPEKNAHTAFLAKFPVAPSSRIKGELYAVRPYQFLELDKYHLNGYHFTRQRVHLAIPYSQIMWLKQHHDVGGEHRSSTYKTDTKIALVKAWMYIGVPDYWNSQLDAGFLFSPVKLFSVDQRPWIQNYYNFTKQEYDVKDNSG